MGSISKADVSLSHKSTTILGQIPAPAWARFLLLARRVSVPGQVPLAGTPLLRACLGVGLGLHSPHQQLWMLLFPTRRAAATCWLRSGQAESVGTEGAFFSNVPVPPASVNPRNDGRTEDAQLCC